MSYCPCVRKCSIVAWFQEQSCWFLATTGHLNWEVNWVMVEHKCPKGDSWNEARCKQIELHYMEVLMVRKGKSCGNLPSRNSTATIGVFWGHGLYDSSDLLFTDEEEQMWRFLHPFFPSAGTR
ncbi:hypothetical protein LOTGIDRAFT_238610 [Lottia gigantea]|uniref:Uncharacterized protein n=1 Tax=Lottia gigantea TaxID=225164 RepID=V4A8Q2_LOTGI|nr:hypothetical protein LOTGIDRAFT_238610 [Lottia gigantea]ESP00329.1 hypothetical protein LOTGIDRAFT_238610 [Lottia gigantea]